MTALDVLTDGPRGCLSVENGCQPLAVGAAFACELRQPAGYAWRVESACPQVQVQLNVDPEGLRTQVQVRGVAAGRARVVLSLNDADSEPQARIGRCFDVVVQH